MLRWCEDRGLPRGEFMSLDTCWKLARAWYPARLNPGWQRKNAQETQAVFDALGLTGESWRVL